MSELVPIPSTVRSQALDAAIRAAITPHPDLLPVPVASWMRPAAEAEHAALVAALEPAGARVVAAWLAPLLLLVAKAPTGDAARITVRAMADALADLPACCWTPDTLREAARTFKWWPSVAEVAELVQTRSEQLRKERTALSRMLHAPTRRGSPEERGETALERAAHAEANRMAVEALKAELAGKERAARSRAATPLVLSPQQRIAFHRAKGQHAVADAIAKANGLDGQTEDAA
jgi:hypothetical protein